MGHMIEIMFLFYLSITLEFFSFCHFVYEVIVTFISFDDKFGPNFPFGRFETIKKKKKHYS